MASVHAKYQQRDGLSDIFVIRTESILHFPDSKRFCSSSAVVVHPIVACAWLLIFEYDIAWVWYLMRKVSCGMFISSPCLSAFFVITTMYWCASFPDMLGIPYCSCGYRYSTLQDTTKKDIYLFTVIVGSVYCLRRYVELTKSHKITHRSHKISLRKAGSG